MDKIARKMRDAFDIPYSAALDIKRKLTVTPEYIKALDEGRARGKTREEVVLELAKPIVDSLYEDKG